jgi:hypothetical protein
MNRRSFLRGAIAGAGAVTAWQLADARELAMLRAPGVVPLLTEPWTDPEETKTGSSYRKIKAYIDSVPSIDMHEHLEQFDHLRGFVETERGPGMNLYGLWKGSYASRINSLTPWNPGEKFETWWQIAKHDFDDIRATDFYRYMWLAFLDLYRVDFDKIADAQAAELNRRIFENYRDERWLNYVLRKRANIELMVNDRYWKRFDFHADYPFEFLTLNVTTLVWGFHPSEYVVGNHDREIRGSFDDPYLYARQRRLPLNSLDDYLSLLNQMFVEAKQGDAVCLKTTLAYTRTLYFENVSKERAAKAFGRPRSMLTPEQAKAFEDYIMWRLAELSAKHDMPFQIHTGDARIEHSNPMLLVNLIEANPQTKFELFHGGYPWVRETGAIGQKFGSHVWVNCVWLPAISYATAKSAFSEWLEVMPSSRITWGGDDKSAEGIYGETELTRRCWAEVLAEKVSRRELAEEDALRIGRQIFRENALDLYPRLKEKAEQLHAAKELPAAKG